MAVASQYNPLNGLIKSPVNRSGVVPTAAQTQFVPNAGSRAIPGGPVPPSTSSTALPGPITVGSVSAVNPDYASLIASDPAFLQTEAGLQATNVSDTASRNAALRSAIISWGKLPDPNKMAASLGLSPDDLQSFLGPDIGQLAQENTDAGTSLLARLNADNTKAIQGIQNSLNARGIYRSGETGYQLGQQNQNYAQSQFDTLQKVLQAMNGAQASYLGSEQANQATLAQAASDAANRAYTNYPGSPGTPGVSADYFGTDTAGNAVYRDSTGNYYNQDGSAYTGTNGTQYLSLAPKQPLHYRPRNPQHGI